MTQPRMQQSITAGIRLARLRVSGEEPTLHLGSANLHKLSFGSIGGCVDLSYASLSSLVIDTSSTSPQPRKKPSFAP